MASMISPIWAVFSESCCTSDAIASTLSRIWSIPPTIASTASAPSLEARTASWACVATSFALSAACCADARISSVAVVV